MSAAEVFEGLQISSNDQRLYRYLTLPNQLKVLLISDKDTEKCSACCDVHIGSLCDPNDIHGLAHFLEHMLFMGTEKYPEENEYSVYITAHGGFSNAYTSQEDTVYYFDIQNNSFENALNLFATFFWCPLFNESSMQRELQAVDNENTKNLQSDPWRTYQLLKSLAKPDHPLNKFSTGNLETLKIQPEAMGIDLRERLMQFHREYYSANLMSLVIYGNQPLDTLQQWVEEKFSPIENKNLTVPRFPTAPFGPEELGVMIEVVPVKDLKDLDIYIPLPSVQDHYRVKPIEHLSHLVGHEGAGSILSVLKQMGWANSLGSMLHTSSTDFSIFSATIGLTDSGLEHIPEIVTIFFEYIGMLKREGPQQWIANEVKETHDLSFRFINKTEPADYATRLANAMHLFPKEHIVSGEKLIFDTDTGFDLISDLLSNYFKPNNSAVLVKHKKFQGHTTKEERWYGTQYNSRPFSTEEFEKWNDAVNGNIRSALHLPIPNPFIATDFTLHEIPEDWKETHEHSRLYGPVVLEKSSVEDRSIECIYLEGEETETSPVTDAAVDAGAAEQDEYEEEQSPGALAQTSGRNHLVWFLQDSVWKVPKVNVFISLRTGYAYHSPLNITLCELFAETMKENLNESTYYADCADLYYDITQTYHGFDLSFSGYHDKLPLLINNTLEEMCRLSNPASSGTSPELFARLKEKILRSYANSLFLAPYNHCIIGSMMCLEEPRWSNLDKYHALKSVTLESFQLFCLLILKSLYLEILITGNITPQQAQELSHEIRQKLPTTVNPLVSALDPIRRSVQLNPLVEYHYRQCASQTNPNELNSAIENTYLMYEHAGYLPPQEVQALIDSTELFSENISSWSSLSHSAALSFLSHLLTEPCFDQLRTKEQLGYIVHSSPTSVGSQCGLRIIIQSNSKDPLYLDERIESFLNDYEIKLQNLSSEEFEQNRQAVIESLLEKPKNINSESKQNWSEITKNLYLFRRKNIQASLVRRLRLEDLLLFYRTYLLSSSPRRSKFSSQFFGKGKKIPRKAASEKTSSKEIIVITDPTLFKRTLPLRPFKTYHEMVEVVTGH